MAKRFHNENALDLPELELTSQSTNYIDLKRLIFFLY